MNVVISSVGYKQHGKFPLIICKCYMLPQNSCVSCQTLLATISIPCGKEDVMMKPNSPSCCNANMHRVKFIKYNVNQCQVVEFWEELKSGIIAFRTAPNHGADTKLISVYVYLVFGFHVSYLKQINKKYLVKAPLKWVKSTISKFEK